MVPGRHADVPQDGADGGVTSTRQLRLEQARYQPQAHPDSRHRGPAVGHYVQVGRAHPAKGEYRVGHQPVRQVQLE